MNDLLAELNGGDMPVLDLIFMVTLVAFLSSIAVTMTSFTRTITILSFTRDATGVRRTPPSMVLVGIALFPALCIINPVIEKISEEVYQPYVRGEITRQEATGRMGGSLKKFTLRNTEKSTLDHFAQMSGTDICENVEDYPLTVVTPALMASELKRSFISGFLIYLPFLLINIVVAITLISMGMIMLLSIMITLLFKLLSFVTVDRWELLFSSIIQSL